MYANAAGQRIHDTAEKRALWANGIRPAAMWPAGRRSAEVRRSSYTWPWTTGTRGTASIHTVDVDARPTASAEPEPLQPPPWSCLVLF